MYKVIELGATVPGTGEARVSLIKDGIFQKTASSEIQDYWDKLSKEDGKAYLWVIGVSAQEFYGCNSNGDAFTEADLKKNHHYFTDEAHVFMHHVNKDPAKSIGKPVFTWYNDDMHRVEMILGIDRNANGAAAIVQRLERGEQLYVSMGCRVAFDQCSICGNKAPSRMKYCEHLRYHMKKILKDGRQVCAYNPDPHFFDISIVNRPADPTAFALDKIASEGGMEYEDIEKTSAELGEEAEAYQQKLAAVDKLADIIKRVKGEIVDHTGIRDIRERGFEDTEYPSTPHKKLIVMKVSPGGLAALMPSLGAPLSFGDALYMGGRHMFGDGFTESLIPSIMEMIPRALGILHEHPEHLDGIVREVTGDYGGEFDDPVRRDSIVRAMRPHAEIRITVFSKMAESVTEEKVPGLAREIFSSQGSNFKPVVLKDGSKTSPYHIRETAQFENLGGLRSKVLGAALGAAAIGAVLTAPSSADAMLYGTVMGLPAAHLLMGNKPDKVVKTEDGRTVSAGLMKNTWRSHPDREKVASLRLPTIAGMAIPAALALDYSFNDWVYDNDPMAQMQNDSYFDRIRNHVGKFSKENPLIAVTLGGLAGAALPFGRR